MGTQDGNFMLKMKNEWIETYYFRLFVKIFSAFKELFTFASHFLTEKTREIIL